VTIDDAQQQWDLIRDLWDALGLDDQLRRDWPPAQHWQLDLLRRRLRRTNEIFEEYRAAEAALLEAMDT
jgi:hypothetical protein